MALSRREAADVLARIGADAEARERFLAAYAGDEDAIAALQEAADPERGSASSLARELRLKSYQRAAYGRATTPEEHAAATRAREAIIRELDHRALLQAALETAARAIADPSVEPSDSPAAPGPVEPGAAEPGAIDPHSAEAGSVERKSPGEPRRRLSIRAIVAIAVGAGLVLGLAIAVGLGFYLGANRALIISRLPQAHSSAPHQSPTHTPVTSLVTRTYTSQQIAAWFAAASTSDDTFPQPNYLAFIGLGSSTTRFIATSDTGFSLWIGKSTSGETCLLMNGTVKGQQVGSLSKCLPDAAIKQGKALVLNQHGLDATLTARDLVVAVTST